jgi:mRNA N6-methyladenine demethylase
MNAVLAGQSDRYASTHRVCRTDGHTFQSIRQRCLSALQGAGSSSSSSSSSSSAASVSFAKQIRTEQLTMNEVEFEWIRQFYVQGKRHYELHTWWHQPMQELLELWSRLDARSSSAIQALEDAAGKHCVALRSPELHVPLTTEI